MRNRVHGSGTMAGAWSGEKKGNVSSLNLTAHINSRERVSFRRYKSGTAPKRVFARCSIRVGTIPLGELSSKKLPRINKRPKCVLK